MKCPNCQQELLPDPYEINDYLFCLNDKCDISSRNLNDNIIYIKKDFFQWSLPLNYYKFAIFMKSYDEDSLTIRDMRCFLLSNKYPDLKIPYIPLDIIDINNTINRIKKLLLFS